MANHVYNWQPQLPDKRNYPSHVKTKLILPREVDLRPKFIAPFDQLEEGSCTANETAGAMWYYWNGQHQKFTPVFSRQFIYYNERNYEGTPNEDSGAIVHDGFRVVRKYGAPTEESWPYSQPFNLKPDANSFSTAKQWRIPFYRHPAQTARALKSVLAAGYPIGFGFTVYDSFESEAVARSGVVPLPSRSESVLGGHAVLLVGYLKYNGAWYFIVRNSWGTNWGKAGYFFMPFDYVLDKELCSDFRYFSAS